MTTLLKLQAELNAIKEDLKANQNWLEQKEEDRDSVELACDDFIDEYEEMLNECEGEFMGMQASYILKECDPTAYRCGLIDYVDSLDVEDYQEYQDLQSQIEGLESTIESLEGQIEDLEDEISELEE